MLLVVALPLASAVHTAHVDGAATAGVGANGHGPWAPCPAAQDAPCVACSAATLFEGPHAVARLFAPLTSDVLREIRCDAAERAPASTANGRSPPAS